jgi:hypothetical protein
MLSSGFTFGSVSALEHPKNAKVINNRDGKCLGNSFKMMLLLLYYRYNADGNELCVQYPKQKYNTLPNSLSDHQPGHKLLFMLYTLDQGNNFYIYIKPDCHECHTIIYHRFCHVRISDMVCIIGHVKTPQIFSNPVRHLLTVCQSILPEANDAFHSLRLTS